MKLRLPLFISTSPIHLAFRIVTPLVKIGQTVFLYHYSAPLTFLLHPFVRPLVVRCVTRRAWISNIGYRETNGNVCLSLVTQRYSSIGFEDQTDSMKLHGFGHVQNGSSGANNCPFPLRLSNWRGRREGEGEKRVLDGVKETLDGTTEMLDGRTGTLDGRTGTLDGRREHWMVGRGRWMVGGGCWIVRWGC